MFSVNTNAGAFAALQNLNASNKVLETTQSRINSGLKVSSARDDAATYSIAQTMRGDVAGLNAVNQSLSRAISEVDVALAAGETISDLLIEMKEKAVAAKDSGLDATSREALNNDYVQLKEQITSIAENATFNGKNLLTGDALTAITDSNGTESGTITASGNALTLSVLGLDDGDLISSGSPPAGTPEALAGQFIATGSDSDFLNAVINLQNENGGNFNGETINTTTGVTTNNVGAGLSSEFANGLATALGFSSLGDHFSSSRLDGYEFDFTVRSDSNMYLLRNGTSSSLHIGDPTDTGDASSSTAANAAVDAVEAAIDTVNDVLSELGATSNRLAIQQQFAGKLSDGLGVGIGNLVDADLAKESARLQSYQTKQQLGLQALSIANQSPQSVLSLFQ